MLCDNCKKEIKKPLIDWCNTCKHIRQDADYCLACTDKSLREIIVSEPKGYKKNKGEN